MRPTLSRTAQITPRTLPRHPRESPDALPERLSHDLLSFLEACDHAKFKSGSDSEGIKTQLWEAADALVRNAPAPEPVKSAPAA